MKRAGKEVCPSNEFSNSSSSGTRHCRITDDAGRWMLAAVTLPHRRPSRSGRRFGPPAGTLIRVFDRAPAGRPGSPWTPTLCVSAACCSRVLASFRSAFTLRVTGHLGRAKHPRACPKGVEASRLALTSFARCSRTQGPLSAHSTGDRRRLRTDRRFFLMGAPAEPISEPKTAAMSFSQSSSSARRRKTAHAADGCHKHPCRGVGRAASAR